MAPSPAPRLSWMDGRATLTMKKSRTNMNVPIMSTARADQPASGLDRTRKWRCCVHTPSLWPPLTGESSGLEDRPADLGAVPGQVGFGERDQVILADRALDADSPLGHDRAQRAVGLVGVGRRS